MYNYHISIIQIKGEVITASVDGDIFKFLVLGDGLCPIGKKGILVSALVKEYLKKHHMAELVSIKLNQL